MSVATLAILNQQREDQLRLSPSSEEFTIVGGGSFFGVFDDSHIEDQKDTGNVKQKKRVPRIMVSTIPSGMTERTTRITREDGVSTYTLNYIGKDEGGLPIIWLY